MKFALFYSILATAATAATATMGVADDDMIVVTQKTTFSFNVNSEGEPIQSPEKDAYVESCLSSTYNAIHDPSQYEIKGVELEEESVQKEEANNEQLANLAQTLYPFPNWWDWYYYTNVQYAVCRLCLPTSHVALKDRNYPEWEETFCTCLNAGPFDDLKTASHCRIERTGEAVTKTEPEPEPHVQDDDMILVNQKTTFTFNVNSEGEPPQSNEKDSYIEGCLGSTYNAIHDPAEYQIKAIELEEETVQKEEANNEQLANVAQTLYPFPNWWDWYYYTNVQYAVCRLCLPATGFALQDRNYPEWEEAFCTCLNAGPFDDLKTASHCRIERSGSAIVQSENKKAPHLLRGAQQQVAHYF